MVLALTAADVVDAETRKPGEQILTNEIISHAIKDPNLMAARSSYQLLSANPVDWLTHWIQNPNKDELRKAARVVPYVFLPEAKAYLLAETDSRSELAYQVLSNKKPTKKTGFRQVWVWQKDGLAAAVELLEKSRIAISLVVDDHDQALLADDSAAWRSWLRFSNAMALRDWPTEITTSSLIAAGELKYQDETLEITETAGMPQEWAALMPEAERSEQLVLKKMAEAGITTVPELGHEGPDGIPLDICWPKANVVIEVAELTPQDRNDLKSAGWTILAAEAEKLLEDLASAGVK